jgi:hypothetical protein
MSNVDGKALLWYTPVSARGPDEADKGRHEVKRGGTYMPSNTKKTELKRKRKRTSLGKDRKKMLAKQSTPAFPIHVVKDA